MGRKVLLLDTLSKRIMKDCKAASFILVRSSFDHDFDRTDIIRKEPKDFL